MGQVLSRTATKQKLADLQKQLKDGQAALGKRDDDLKAKDAELQAAKAQHSQTQDQLNGLQTSLKRNGEDAEKQRKDLEDRAAALTKERDQAQLDRDNNEKQRKDLEGRAAALTKERDQAQHDRDNHEIRAKALEYSNKRVSRDLAAAKEGSQGPSEESVAALAAQREASDKQRRELEDKAASLTKERDKANSDRDLHEIRNNALVYSHNREKKATSEAHEEEKGGLKKAHDALLQYHEQAKNDWRGLLLQAGLEGEALRLQKQALQKEYDGASTSKKAHQALLQYYEHAKNDWRGLLLQAQLEAEALRLQKQHLLAAYASKEESERKLHHLRQNHAELTRDLGKSESKLAGATTEVAATRSLHKDTSDFHDLTQRQLTAANTDLAQTKEDHSALLSAHEALKNDAAKKYTMQEDDHAVTRGKLDTLQKQHDALQSEHDAVKKDLDAKTRAGLDQASELDKAKQGLTSAQSEKSDLESKVKTLETEKEQHRQTGVELANQLSASKANVERLEKEAQDRRDSGMKIDSPLQQSEPVSNAISYNVNNL